MSFISNASGFTLGEGTYNSAQGNINNAQRDINDVHVNIYQHEGQRVDIGALLESLLGDKRRRREDSTDTEEPARKRRGENPGEEDGPEIIRYKDLKVTDEIGRGPGYLLYVGDIQRRAVIVKVFTAGTNARKHWEATVNLSERLLHPNVLRIEGTSSPASMHHFIAYEDAQGKKAAGPLAIALRDDLDTGILLGFKMISSLSAGIDYLSAQGITLTLGPESFDVFLDINDRFLLCINPPTDATHHEEDNTHGVWTLFNELCQKVLRSANRLLHDEDIKRTPAVFDDPSPRSPDMLKISVVTSRDQPTVQTEEFTATARDTAPSVPPRREFVWRMMDAPQSLASIATQIARDLDLRRASVNRLNRSDGGSIHRCPGYIREEVTLATRIADSAVVSHDTPTIHEVCSVCHEVVNSGEVFRCVCGQEEPGSGPTVKCRSCKSWSHRDCGPTSTESICSLCSAVNSTLPQEDQIQSGGKVVDADVFPVGSGITGQDAEMGKGTGRSRLPPGPGLDLANTERTQARAAETLGRVASLDLDEILKTRMPRVWEFKEMMRESGFPESKRVSFLPSCPGTPLMCTSPPLGLGLPSD
ncbi:hypothetical protein FB45DRAFT_258547 [Roridomyces roridus]|uniref:Protein kinase domain-containing protein n=1 Tax=Roridomyces roridus TaxID=1738132 RepID=A0AAD7FBC1_9AGAR|nr:hypothetical protein FB45DRAFT_258547 [Roridomyces roridus]